MGPIEIESKIGEGMILFSRTSLTGFENYLEMDRKAKGSTAFAYSRVQDTSGSGWSQKRHISASAKADATRSRAIKDATRSRAIRKALEYCGQEDCKIYSIDGKVVWKNPEEPVGIASIGKGAIELTENIKKYYREYKQTRTKFENSAMAISLDTRSAASVWRNESDLDLIMEEAVKRCNVLASVRGVGQNCAIYDTNGEIVWELDG